MNDTELVLRDGKVALKQIGKNNIPVPVVVDGVTYLASIQHNVWIVWVEEKHAEELLTKKIKGCDCNGGAYKPLFKYASVTDVSIYDTGDRPR